MEEIASAVESDLGDTRGEGALGDRLADDGGGVDAVLLLLRNTTMRGRSAVPLTCLRMR